MALPDKFRFMWNDQEELNKLFRPEGSPTDPAARTALSKDMVLHLFTECDEFLRTCGPWKIHRNVSSPDNRRARLIELADIGKYWLTLAQIWGYTEDELFEAMREKSMVVRQRHSEEWVQTLGRPSIIVDIDQILADYVLGFLQWLVEKKLVEVGIASDVRRLHKWAGHEALGMDAQTYGAYRHEFRVSGAHADLPVMPGADDFLIWAKRRWQVILLTSRPIHEYPNIYGETLMWLDRNGLPYDRVWWATDKGAACLDRGVAPNVKFMVDDEFRYVLQTADLGIQSFWMPVDPHNDHSRHDRPITKIRRLEDIMTIMGGVASERK